VEEALRVAAQVHDKPTMVIARTTKGKGVSFMENNSFWHGNVPNADQMKQAMTELGEVNHG
jgi:transketolase